MPFLDDLTALQDQPAKQVALLQEWLATKPRTLFDELRPVEPILVLPGLAVVTKHRDVVDVLARDMEFNVSPYASKMHRATGDFFLGMQDGATYEREVSIMRLASSREDLPRLEQDIENWANEYVGQKAASGQLDVVGDVARRVPGRLVSDYFGASGVPEPQLLQWLRDLFHDIFINPGDQDPAVKDAAALASTELCTHLDNVIAAQMEATRNGTVLPDTVLARCVAMTAVPETALDPLGIRRNIAGLIVGTIDTTSDCVGKVLDYLLDNPKLLDSAVTAAHSGTLDDVRGYVYEALRFHPQAPSLIRVAGQDTVLAAGTADSTTIPAGTTVIVALMSAMFDPEAFPAPEAFNNSRPERSYLHFGSGMHQCFGRYINRLQLPIIVRAILRLPGLRRAAGADGAMKFDGPFPDRLLVEFDTIG
jgi:cytochrome P450